MGYSDLPPFAQKTGNGGLSIRTSDTQFARAYTIQLMVMPNGPTTVDPVFIEYQLSISACRVNRVFVLSSQPDLTYQIGAGPLLIPDGFGSEQDLCTLSYSLVEEGKSTYDQNIFQFNSNSAVVTIDTSDNSLHQTEKTLILRVLSVESGSVAQQIFTVSFFNGCNDLILTPAAFEKFQGTV